MMIVVNISHFIYFVYEMQNSDVIQESIQLYDILQRLSLTFRVKNCEHGQACDGKI